LRVYSGLDIVHANHRPTLLRISGLRRFGEDEPMGIDTAGRFLPVAPPRVFDDLFTPEQHSRMLDVIRANGPWSLILAQYFSSPEEVIATSSGSIPKGLKPTWDMFMNPVFRGNFGQNGVCFYPELDDCFYNKKFLDLVRDYWNTPYVEVDQLFFNIQGPTSAGGAPHFDGTHFRGLYANNTPIWLLNIMAKSGLFQRWQARKAQVISWYYNGPIGGGFHYWPNGPQEDPALLAAPMWGRGVVVENEMMFHQAQGCGPVAMRKPQGLAINSKMGPDPDAPGGWRIMTGETVIQNIPEEEFRLLVHWGAQVYPTLADLKLARDHTDDITVDKAFDIFVADLRARDVVFEMPSDPLHDIKFIQLLTQQYDLGLPKNIPEDPVDQRRVA
jgi:hypothetical protein